MITKALCPCHLRREGLPSGLDPVTVVVLIRTTGWPQSEIINCSKTPFPFSANTAAVLQEKRTS